VTARKILVIDDSRVIRNMVRDMLPPGNIEILEAADGIKGLEIVQKEIPWLIMLDFLLPRMSGYEVYDRIQQNRELSCIPLVLMSGRKEEVTSKIPEPFEEKYFAFIEKPFEQRQLLAAIKKSLELAKEKERLLPAVPEPILEISKDSANAAIALDQALLERLEALEAKSKNIEGMEAKLKVLEQQVVIQYKQIQQLAAFIKQKFK